MHLVMVLPVCYVYRRRGIFFGNKSTNFVASQRFKNKGKERNVVALSMRSATNIVGYNAF